MSTATTHHRSGAHDLALLVLRVALGAIFIAHGGQKLFWSGIAGTTEAFVGMGVFLPELTAPAVTIVEFFGGLALVAGLFTRLAAASIAVVMLGAIVMVHLPAGFFLPNGIEFALLNFAAAVALALLGAGAYSVDGKRAVARHEARSPASTAPAGTSSATGTPATKDTSPDTGTSSAAGAGEGSDVP